MVAKCKLFTYQVHISKHNMSKISQLMESKFSLQKSAT